MTMGPAPTLVLRADGGPRIGGGHVMRCLALAQAWSETSGRAVFCAASLAPSLKQRLVDEGFGAVTVEAAPGSAADAEATVAVARSLGAGIVVVDGYDFPTAFHGALRAAGMRTAMIDDIGSSGVRADIVINHHRHAAPALYPAPVDETRLLLGTDYALLRREFRQWQGAARAFPKQARQILVTLGSADPQDVTSEIVARLGPVLPAETDVAILVGGSNPHADVIAAAAKSLPKCRLLQDPGEAMPRLMAAADLAVCAGGGTMLELAHMGVPFIPVIIADNQRAPTSALRGDGYPVMEAAAVARDLPAAASALAADAGRREALSRRGCQLVDGRGAERVCAALRALAA
jgi:UDP-2,4-diacetamido-2,4,6-trideoxy-beta-L-altropyranose hydrolase